MAAHARGDSASFATLFERWKSRVYRYCLYVIGNGTLADDALQETFLRVLRYAASFRTDQRFAGWLFAIARNACLRILERERISVQYDEELLGESTADASEGADVFEAQEVRDALERLPLGLREPLVLFEFEGFSHREIAELIGITEGAAKVRVFRARQKLRRMLERRLRGAREGGTHHDV